MAKKNNAVEVETSNVEVKETSNVEVKETSNVEVKETSNVEVLPPVDETLIIPHFDSLDKATSFIEGVANRMKKDLVQIAFALADVKKYKLYEQRNYKDVYDYAENMTFGYKKDTVAKLIRVAETFLDRISGHSVLVENGEKDFSMGALQELLLLPSPVEMAAEMIKQGELNPQMSTKQIRNAVKSKRGKSEKAEKNISENSNYTDSEIDSAEIDKNAEKQLEIYSKVDAINSAFNSAYNEVKAAVENTEIEGIDDNLIKIRESQKQLHDIILTGGNTEIANVMQSKIDSLSSENETLKKDAENFDGEKNMLVKGYEKIISSKDAEIAKLQAEIEKLKSELSLARIGQGGGLYRYSATADDSNEVNKK